MRFSAPTFSDPVQPPSADGRPLHNSALKCMQCVVPPPLPHVEPAASTLVPPVIPASVAPSRAAAFANAIAVVNSASSAIATAHAVAAAAATQKPPLSSAPVETGLFASQIHVGSVGEGPHLHPPSPPSIA